VNLSPLQLVTAPARERRKFRQQICGGEMLMASLPGPDSHISHARCGLGGTGIKILLMKFILPFTGKSIISSQTKKHQQIQ
jgi:hypothetical protein